MGSSFSFSVLLALFLVPATIRGRPAHAYDGILGSNSTDLVVGAIVDWSSRIGKEEMVAMQMAADELNEHGNQSLTLDVRNSNRAEPLQAALAAQDLVSKKVKAILGAQTWEEESLVAEVGSRNQVPVLSFSGSSREWATERWPFLVEFSPNKYAQMKAIAAVAQSFEWNQVTLIYEDDDSSITGIINYLSDALLEAGARISCLQAIPIHASSSLSKELEILRKGQCRVFVVHLSFPVAFQFFKTAKKMKMMEKQYVWITTDAITSLVHSFNASVISSMQGVLGVKGHFQEDGHRHHVFIQKFQERFSRAFPEEVHHDPGVYAFQAYDAVQTVARAIRESNNSSEEFLEKMLLANFDGLAGKVVFSKNKLPLVHTFQIINVVGRSYRGLGFWSDKFGFSETTGAKATYFSSMKDLGQVFWPGGPWYIPLGWTASSYEKPLNIGVPANSTFKEFVSVEVDPKTNETIIKGYTIDLFKAAREKLPFDLPYKFFPFPGKYDDLVQQVYLKNIDAAVGNIAIVSSRFQYADFTLPFTDPELVMIVRVQTTLSNRAWLFLKPFTMCMWFLICFISFFNGVVIWLIERTHYPELKGSILNQVGVVGWLSLTTVIPSQGGGRPHRNLSRLAMVVWMLVGLAIMLIYTANLSSILTVQGLLPTVDSVEELLKMNAVVGQLKLSFTVTYMINFLHFNPKNIRDCSDSADCARLLHNGEIKAFFVAKSLAKLFLAKYCKGFTMAKPSYRVGGSGFAFPKGSPLATYMSEALVRVFETGEVQDLEKAMYSSKDCKEEFEVGDEILRLGPRSLWVLFALTGGTSTIALLIYVIGDHGHAFSQRTLWSVMFAILRRWRNQRRRLYKIFRGVSGSPGHSSTNSSLGSPVNSQVLARQSLPAYM